MKSSGDTLFLRGRGPGPASNGLGAGGPCVLGPPRKRKDHRPLRAGAHQTVNADDQPLVTGWLSLDGVNAHVFIGAETLGEPNGRTYAGSQSPFALVRIASAVRSAASARTIPRCGLRRIGCALGWMPGARGAHWNHNPEEADHDDFPHHRPSPWSARPA